MVYHRFWFTGPARVPVNLTPDSYAGTPKFGILDAKRI